MRKPIWGVWAAVALGGFAAPEGPPGWTKLDSAAVGDRYDIPLAYAPAEDRFLILGGRTHWGVYKKGPRPYDELGLDLGQGRWENLYPKGKEWGPPSGACSAPLWKGEAWSLTDLEGNTRPNWTVYGTFSIGRKYAYDPGSRSFILYAGGTTAAYDPAARAWKDLGAAVHPEGALGGILLWSSMCADPERGRVILFGGGNVETPRGDPGTWAFTPSTRSWERLRPEIEPPQRANAPLVYDPVAKKIVLFGGDQLDGLLSDTWTFDGTRWEEKHPPVAPAPRAGHAMLWLPKAGKILLLGGYGYDSKTGYMGGFYKSLPWEAWTYDLSVDRWDLVERITDPKVAPESPMHSFLSAAASSDDTVVVLSGRNETWVRRWGTLAVDAPGTEKFGVKPGTITRRDGPYDPQWYREGVPPADPAKVESDLAKIPVNLWETRPTPRIPRPNMDWGSAVFASDRDLILRFSGGHSAYSGTAPQVYDPKTDHYSIPFAPEMPIEYVCSNDQVHGEWSFRQNPWMTGHTYKSTGYDPNLRQLVFAAHGYTYFFDPGAGKWTRSEGRSPFRPNMYATTLTTTPRGVVAWAEHPKDRTQSGLWRLDGASRAWEELPVSGKLPRMSPDQHGMAYDSKRDRLLLFSNAEPKAGGDVVEVGLKSGEARPLGPAGREAARVASRETAYLPEEDLVMIGAHAAAASGKRLWLFYDCARNAWRGAELPGEDPVGKGTFNNSMGLMYDPGRKLVWAVGQNSDVHVLRFEARTAGLEDLK